MMRTSTPRLVYMGLLALVAVFATGCVGIYDNTDLFRRSPQTGTPEADVLRNYGTPAYAGFAEDQKIYTYRVRDNKYIILFGLYDGYDLVITCENGEVVQTDEVRRPSTFALLSPLPWGEDYR